MAETTLTAHGAIPRREAMAAGIAVNPSPPREARQAVMLDFRPELSGLFVSWERADRG